SRLSERSAALTYFGIDGQARTTVLQFTPEPTHLDVASARYDLMLEPQGQTRLFIAIACMADAKPAETNAAYSGSINAARRALGTATRRAARAVASNSQFNQLLSRSVSDLYMLLTGTKYSPYPYAGIPWFCTACGRDGLLTALFTLWMDPTIAAGVLRYLAATQARTHDPVRDAEPGKILHETRSSEMARLGEVPFGMYYGSVDATPLYVVLAGAYVDRTGDLETLRSIWPNIVAALGWIDRYGDSDGDGFVEYNRHTETGLVNQGWKDSHDSIFHADGRLALGPIALCEVQAYVFLAKQRAAAMARRLGLPDMAADLHRQ